MSLVETFSSLPGQIRGAKCYFVKLNRGCSGNASTCLHLEVGLHLDADLEVFAALLIEGGVQAARVADLPGEGHVVRLVPAQDTQDADVASRYLW